MPGRGHGRSMGSDPPSSRTPRGVLFPGHDGRGDGFNNNFVGSGRGVRVPRQTSGGRGRGRGNGSMTPGPVPITHPSFRSKDDLPQLSIVYELPENSDSLARDFDEISDLIHSGRIKINDYLSKKFGFDVTDPENWPTLPGGANLFHDGCFPKFPTWPKNGNPFELLPLKKRGYFPFDDYGKLVFFESELDKWYNTSFFDEELFEIQFRELTHVLQLNGRWVVDLEASEGESYGTCKILSNYPVEKQLERVGARDLKELDSGFVTESFDDIADPCSFDPKFLDNLEPNDFSWEPRTGSGFVQPNVSMTRYEESTYVRSKVSDWSILIYQLFEIIKIILFTLFLGQSQTWDRYRSTHQYQILVASNWKRSCIAQAWRQIRLVLHL